MSLKAYRITAMTGRSCRELVYEATTYEWFCSLAGIELLDPVLIEGIPNEDRPLEALPDEILKRLWLRDKECLREAHIAINSNAELKSIGSEHEQGLMRFGYWKPLILVYPNGRLPFISRYEDDLVVESFFDACELAVRLWGTYPKRLKWRVGMLARSVPKFVWRQLKFLVQ